MTTFIITLVSIWPWMAIGFIALALKMPRLDNALQGVVYMAAWPWFLLRGKK